MPPMPLAAVRHEVLKYCEGARVPPHHVEEIAARRREPGRMQNAREGREEKNNGRPQAASVTIQFVRAARIIFKRALIL